jgi:ethanolamine-phosphate cytidylyltransferase
VLTQLATSSSVPRPLPAADSADGAKPLRIWMDGAFDMMHYGHVNAFRQGRSLGTHLVVGVNDDESITRCKGPPVMNNAERLAMVEGCKFVDEVVPNVPYVMSDEYVRWMITTYKIDFVVHGDDPCIVDGRDVYESAVRLGKYRTIPRTEGVSTTDIVGRMLLLTTDHHNKPSPNASKDSDADGEPRVDRQASPLVGALATDAGGQKLSSCVPSLPLDAAAPAPPVAASAPVAEMTSFVRESKFLTTSRMLRLFAAGCNAPPPGAKVVYVDGGWDVRRARVALLRRCAAPCCAAWRPWPSSLSLSLSWATAAPRGRAHGRQATPRHATPRHATPRHATPRHATRT